MPEQTWQPAEGAAVDTMIDEEFPAVNYGGAGTLEVEHGNNASDNRDILMKWDLSPIPAGSTIEIATLYLFITAEIGGAGGITLYHMDRLLSGNSDWTEGGCTWNTQDGVNPWAGGAGCEVVGTDLALTHVWTGDPWQGAPPRWWQFALEISEVQFMLDSENYGFKIYSPVRGVTAHRVHTFTSAAGAAGNRPRLYVRWLEPSGRLVEYTFDVWDPRQRLLGRDGHEVAPNEVRADKWGKLLGFRSPSSKVFKTLAEGPDHWYTSGVTSDGEMVRITPDERLFADMLLKRLAR